MRKKTHGVDAAVCKEVPLPHGKDYLQETVGEKG